jgi:uncharacterized protein
MTTLTLAELRATTAPTKARPQAERPSIKHMGSNRSGCADYVTDGSMLALTEHVKKWRKAMQNRLLAEHRQSQPIDKAGIEHIIPGASARSTYLPLAWVEDIAQADTSGPYNKTYFAADGDNPPVVVDTDKLKLLRYVFDCPLRLQCAPTDGHQKALVLENATTGDFLGLLMPLRDH